MSDEEDFNGSESMDAGMNGMESDDEPYVEDEVGKEVEITKDGGVTKTIISKGEGWKMPEKGDEIFVHYVGKLSDGTVFDSSRERGDPFSFKLGTGCVIKGWDKGLATMKRGEKSTLKCKSEYAYGDAGSPPKIPGGATLEFEVELLSWKSTKDITGDGGVIKTVQTEGSGWETPSAGKAEVCVTYTATHVADAKMFEAVEAKWVELGNGLLVSGVEKALCTMKKGEVAELTIQSEYAYGSEGREGVQPGSAVKYELTLVDFRKIEDLKSDGKILKKTLKEGTGYKTPEDGTAVTVVVARVDVNMSTELSAATEIEYTIGDGTQSLALDELISKMKDGEICVGTCQPPYTDDDAIAPGTAIQYSLELKKMDKGKETWDMSKEEKVEAAVKAKEEGNAFFKSARYHRAQKKYEKALKLSDVHKDDEKEAMQAIRVSSFLNLSQCLSKQNKWPEVISQCNKALELDKSSSKALFRRATAYLESGELLLARQDFKLVLEKDGSTATRRDVKAALDRLRMLQQVQNQQQKGVFSNMFSKQGLYKDKKPEHKKRPSKDELSSDDDDSKENATA